MLIDAAELNFRYFRQRDDYRRLSGVHSEGEVVFVDEKGMGVHDEVPWDKLACLG